MLVLSRLTFAYLEEPWSNNSSNQQWLQEMGETQHSTKQLFDPYSGGELPGAFWNASCAWLCNGKCVSSPVLATGLSTGQPYCMLEMCFTCMYMSLAQLPLFIHAPRLPFSLWGQSTVSTHCRSPHLSWVPCDPTFSFFMQKSGELCR